MLCVETRGARLPRLGDRSGVDGAEAVQGEGDLRRDEPPLHRNGAGGVLTGSELGQVELVLVDSGEVGRLVLATLAVHHGEVEGSDLQQAALAARPVNPALCTRFRKDGVTPLAVEKQSAKNRLSMDELADINSLVLGAIARLSYRSRQAVREGRGWTLAEVEQNVCWAVEELVKG